LSVDFDDISSHVHVPIVITHFSRCMRYPFIVKTLEDLWNYSVLRIIAFIYVN